MEQYPLAVTHGLWVKIGFEVPGVLPIVAEGTGYGNANNIDIR